jgi:hypothetical protein
METVATPFVPHQDTIAREGELRCLGDEIAELSAQLDAATARLLDMIRDFDARDGWGNGFSSCAHWLSWRIGWAPGVAREKVRVARALPALPLIAGAFAKGELSYSKVRELTRVATPETEERLLKFARVGTATHVERLIRGWRRVDRNEEMKETVQRHRSRLLHIYQDDDGSVVIHGRLEPEVGALVMRALEAARETLYQQGRVVDPDQRNHPQADPPSTGQQQADALALLAETALHHGMDPGAAAERYQVVVHVDAAVLTDAGGQSVLEDGLRVPAGTSQRLACDASRVVMRYDEDGNIVEVGARTRTIPPALRRAMQARDRGCRFPGCGLRFGQGHHIQHWAQGGPTTLSNLTMLCRRHHRAVHEEGYSVERQGDGSLLFRTPYGWPLPDAPERAAVSDDPVHALRTTSEAHGMHIDGRTSMPSWLGERLNVVYAIDVLHPLATRPSIRTSQNPSRRRTDPDDCAPAATGCPVIL